MKTLLMAALFASVALPAAADCMKTATGRTICRNAAGQIVATPPGAAAAPAPGAVVVAPGAAAAPVAAAPGAVVVPRPAARAYEGQVTTVQGANGAAAYNPRTGNAAVSETNARGVTTTQTTRGGEAKTKNGMGVAHGPGGKTCVKGRNQAGCN